MGGVETLSQSRELLEPRCAIPAMFASSSSFSSPSRCTFDIRSRRRELGASRSQALSEMDFELKGQPPTAVILERAEPSLAGSPNFQAAPIILDLVILPYGVHELRTRAGQP
ncbi:hypothetical protein CIRG_04646 [Coccidioides immitis RMSCC 2394]|uniref:Uncharacterized protein n=1 Tax=Coccidioides immitis RMSCC 2394 TaxID=404692 RepID=A0A0J6YB49_COCIT|nr:hypothetical protein CIRG_04646 [Coccidioides immitis RMSCC 2394]